MTRFIINDTENSKMVVGGTKVNGIGFRLILPLSLCSVVGTVVSTVVGRVVGFVLFACGGVEVVELMDGIPGGLGVGAVSKQFISGFSFAARGLKANEQRFNHESDAML